MDRLVAQLVGRHQQHAHHRAHSALRARKWHRAPVALKLHPVHARFAPNDAVLWPVYARMQDTGLPVVFHCGTSVFPGAVNRYADPGLVAMTTNLISQTFRSAH